MALDIKETGAGGKNFYFPVVLRVSGVSQYNPDQISFEGVPDFWQLPKDHPVPPKGTVAVFHLSTKPKTGANAKPGSMYRDVIRIEKASDDEKANYSPSPQAPQSARTEYDAPQHQQNGSGAPPVNQWASKDASILKQVGFKAAVELLTAKMTAAKTAYDPFTEKEWGQLAQDVWLSYGLLMSGKNPEQLFPPEIEQHASELTGTDPDDSPLVQAAKDMGAEEQGEDRETLPW